MDKKKVGHFNALMVHEHSPVITKLTSLKLEIIQATTSLIDPGCEIWEDYGIQRSGRRFFTSHATNMGVKRHLIELQARWMVDRANGDRAVQRSMIHVYSEMRNMKEALIKPSKAC